MKAVASAPTSLGRWLKSSDLPSAQSRTASCAAASRSNIVGLNGALLNKAGRFFSALNSAAARSRQLSSFSMGALLGLVRVRAASVNQGRASARLSPLALVPAYPGAAFSSLTRREPLPALASAGAGYFFN